MGAAYLSRPQEADCSGPPRAKPALVYRLVALAAGTFVCTTVWTLVLVASGRLAGIVVRGPTIAAVMLFVAMACWAALAIVVADRA